MTPEATRSLVSEFYALNLRTVLQQNPEKSLSEALQLMIARFERLRPCLHVEHRSDVVFRNRLLNTYRDVEACPLATQKPADTVQGVIADLQSAIAAHTQATTAAPTSPSSMLLANPWSTLFTANSEKGNLNIESLLCLRQALLLHYQAHC